MAAAFAAALGAERLAGAKAGFRQERGAGGVGAFIGESLCRVATMVAGAKAVIVIAALEGVDPIAWDSGMNTACANGLLRAELRKLPQRT